MSEFNTILHDALERQKQELKPCTFCSGTAELVNYGLTGRLKIVQCLDCGARTRAFDPEVKRGESACDAWNRRVGDSK